MSQLTDDHLEELDREGFIIVPGFISGERLERLQAAQRRALPTWEETKQNPPQDQAGNSLLKCFPHEEMELYQAAMHQPSISSISSLPGEWTARSQSNAPRYPM